MEQTKTERRLETMADLVILIISVSILYVMQTILLPIIFSIIIAVILTPFCKLLEKMWVPRALSSILAVILATTVVTGLVIFIVNQVITIGSDGADLQDKFIYIYDSIYDWAHRTIGFKDSSLIDHIKDSWDNILSQGLKYFSVAFSSISTLVANIVMMPLYIFFFLYYRHFFKKFIHRSFKRKSAEDIEKVISELYSVIKSYFFGLLLVMIIVAILNSVGLMIMGISYAWFFGAMASLLMIIPYVGIAIGSIIPALFAVATMDSSLYALGVIAWFQVVQFLEGNIITPNIVGGKVNINPLIAIISLFVWSMLFGFAGLILAIPLTAILKVLLDNTERFSHFGFLMGSPKEKQRKEKKKKIKKTEVEEISLPD